MQSIYSKLGVGNSHYAIIACWEYLHSGGTTRKCILNRMKHWRTEASYEQNAMLRNYILHFSSKRSTSHKNSHIAAPQSKSQSSNVNKENLSDT